MYSIITHNIKVTVMPEYDIKNSYPSDNRFVFRYNIVIENLSNVPVQLIKRHWLIYDLGFGHSEVTGEGVIGLIPEIKPGETFNYFSNVILRSGIGYMQGSYLMKNLQTQETFESFIPRFNLISEVIKN